MKTLSPFQVKPLNAALFLFLFLFSGIFTSSCSRNSNREAEKESADQSASVPVSTVVIPIEGMSCAACAANVKRTVNSLTGINDVEVSLEKRQAKVSFVKEKTSVEQIRKEITELGYKAGQPLEAKKE